MALFGPINTVSEPNGTLTAAQYNAEILGIINHFEPQYMLAHGVSQATMRMQTDPGESGSESVSTSLEDEIKRLRYAIWDAKHFFDGDLLYWYQTPTKWVVESSANSDVFTVFGTHVGFANTLCTLKTNEEDTGSFYFMKCIADSDGTPTTKASIDQDGNIICGSVVPTTPVSQTAGGTGKSTLTAHALLIGAASAEVTILSPNTADYVLMSQGASADPLFGQVNTGGIADLSVTTEKLADLAVTRAKMAAVGQQLSSGVATVSITNYTGYDEIPGTSCDITVVSRPVLIKLQPDGGSITAYLGISSATTTAVLYLRLVRRPSGSTVDTIVARVIPIATINSTAPTSAWVSPGDIYEDTPGAGTFNYRLTASVWGAGQIGYINYVKMLVREL